MNLGFFLERKCLLSLAVSVFSAYRHYGRINSHLQNGLYAYIQEEDRQCKYSVTLRSVRVTTLAISIIYSECVCVTFVIQHANAWVVLYCHLWPLALPCFFHIIS